MTTLEERRHAMGDANADGTVTAQELMNALSDDQITAIDIAFHTRFADDVDMAQRILDYRINMTLGRGDSDEQLHQYLETAVHRLSRIALNANNFDDLDFRETLLSVTEIQVPSVSEIHEFSRLVVHDATLDEIMETMGLTPRTEPLRDRGPVIDV